MKATEIPFNVPSKATVHKAGSVLRNELLDSFHAQESIKTLSTWRSLHSYPINTFQSYLRTKLKNAGYAQYLIAQRLKRLPSIITKLRRFPSMGLETMQDIGGIRVILEKIKDVYALHRTILASKSLHIPVTPPKDYIQEPKKDGYRSLHQVFKFVNKKHPELNVLHIELQLRTKLQHLWATSVETLGSLEKASFKTGDGNANYKRFFQLTSALFALEEQQPVVVDLQHVNKQDMINELKIIEQQLHITTKLAGIAFTAKQIETVTQSYKGYHLLELDVEQKNLSLIPFSAKQIEYAEDLYRVREEATRNNPNISIVLISAGNISEIKKAYPNYFLDTADFLKSLGKYLNS